MIPGASTRIAVVYAEITRKSDLVVVFADGCELEEPEVLVNLQRNVGRVDRVAVLIAAVVEVVNNVDPDLALHLAERLLDHALNNLLEAVVQERVLTVDIQAKLIDAELEQLQIVVEHSDTW